MEYSVLKICRYHLLKICKCCFILTLFNAVVLSYNNDKNSVVNITRRNPNHKKGYCKMLSFNGKSRLSFTLGAINTIPIAGIIQLRPWALLLFLRTHVSCSYWFNRCFGICYGINFLGDRYITITGNNDYGISILQIGFGIIWSYNHNGSNKKNSRRCCSGRLTANGMWGSILDDVLSIEFKPKNIGVNLKLTPIEIVYPSGLHWGINFGVLDLGWLIGKRNNSIFDIVTFINGGNIEVFIGKMVDLTVDVDAKIKIDI